MDSLPRFHLVLVEPEIAPNTGNAGRLALAVGARLHLVHPLGFQTDEKAVRRAGLDYWKHVDVMEHADWNAFQAWAGDRRILVFSSHAAQPYTRAEFQRGDALVFGRESVGLPDAIRRAYPAYTIPMAGATRSLNLSNAVAIIAYAALHRLEPALFD
jgi:tRNA (cytidine/uridine-2'-O-)-methyltransferase